MPFVKGNKPWNAGRLYSNAEKVELSYVCNHCGKSIYIKGYKGFKHEARKYCSQKCQLSHLHATIDYSLISSKKAVISKPCGNPNCGNKIMIPPKKHGHKFCSLACASKCKTIKTKRQTKWPRVEKTCLNPDCKKKFMAFDVKGAKRYCTSFCASHSSVRAKAISETKRLAFLTGRQSPSINVNFKAGNYFSNKFGHAIRYRSSYELAFIRRLEEEATVVDIESEVIRIPYIDKTGRVRIYIPDFLVTYNTPRKELVEVKPKFKLSYDQELLKLFVGFRWAVLNKMSYRLVTEDELFSSVTTKFSEVIQKATAVAEDIQQRYSLNSVVIQRDKLKGLSAYVQ